MPKLRSTPLIDFAAHELSWLSRKEYSGLPDRFPLAFVPGPVYTLYSSMFMAWFARCSALIDWSSLAIVRSSSVERSNATFMVFSVPVTESPTSKLTSLEFWPSCVTFALMTSTACMFSIGFIISPLNDT